MSKSSEYQDLANQAFNQGKKVAELELEVYRMARQKRWEDARSDEGKRVAKREFVEAELEYTEEKETLASLQTAIDIARRRIFKSLPSKTGGSAILKDP